MNGACGKVLAFVRLGRPQFLAGGLLLFGLGAAIAAHEHHALRPATYVLGQLAITLTQWMTQYANDYFDFAADQANDAPTRWSGGSRVLPGGELSPRAALAAAVVLGVAAIAVGAVIAFREPNAARALPLLAAAFMLSWQYSGPPLRLHARGLGAPTAALVVAVLTPLAAVVLAAPLRSVLVFLAVTPLACAQHAMIHVLDLPDAAGDAAGGKRTLVVRRGHAYAADVAIASIFAAFASLLLLVVGGLPLRVAFGVLASAPIAAALAWQLSRRAWENAKGRSTLAFLAVAWFFAMGAGELIAFTSLTRG